MFVINRKGNKEQFDFTKTKEKLIKLSFGLTINIDKLTLEVLSHIKDGMSTSEIDLLTSSISYHKGLENSDYQRLSLRIERDCLEKDIKALCEIFNSINNTNLTPFEYYLQESNILEDKKEIMRLYKYPTWELDYYGFSELKKKYLLKNNEFQIIEQPEWLMGRIGAEFNLTQNELEHLLSPDIMHSSPTLFNSSLKKNQLGSCFLLKPKDSVKGIGKLEYDCLITAARAGGIGFTLSPIRPCGSLIKSTRGRAKGIKPILEAFNKNFLMFDQGNKRPSSCAVYLSMWHGDIEMFIQAGNENSPVDAKQLFYAIWMDEYFMFCKDNDLEWNLVNVDLSGLYGNDFVEKYKSLPPANIIKTVKAKYLWDLLLNEQLSSRVPLYICSNDAANRCSNRYIPIVSSNLCTEIMEPALPDEIAVCNLVSICLPKCVKKSNKKDEFGNYRSKFNYKKFKTLCRLCVDNVNKSIDSTYYPLPEEKKSNMKYRPMSIGLQGWHDLLLDLYIPFESQSALDLLRLISEHMYYNCLERSCELAEIHGPFPEFQNSKMAKGILHFDHFNIQTTLNFEPLRERVKKGCRNSLFIGDMPTASSAPIAMNSFGLEPWQDLIIKRRVSEKEYLIINPRLESLLKNGNLWNENIINYILKNGSLPKDESYGIPHWIFNLYKTSFEIDPFVLIKQRAIRQPFVDQSFSFNWFLEDPDEELLNSLYDECYKSGLKTWSYYIARNIKKKDITQISKDIKQFENTVEIDNSLTFNFDSFVCNLESGCTSCQG